MSSYLLFVYCTAFCYEIFRCFAILAQLFVFICFFFVRFFFLNMFAIMYLFFLCSLYYWFVLFCSFLFVLILLLFCSSFFCSFLSLSYIRGSSFVGSLAIDCFQILFSFVARGKFNKRKTKEKINALSQHCDLSEIDDAVFVAHQVRTRVGANAAAARYFHLGAR